MTNNDLRAKVAELEGESMPATMVRVVVRDIKLASQLELAKQQLGATKQELEDVKRKMGEVEQGHAKAAWELKYVKRHVVELDQQLKDAQEKGCLMEDHLLIISDKMVAIWTKSQGAKEGWEEERCRTLGLEKEVIAVYKELYGFR